MFIRSSNILVLWTLVICQAVIWYTKAYSSQGWTEAGDEQERQVNKYNTIWQVLLRSYVQAMWEPGEGVINSD